MKRGSRISLFHAGSVKRQSRPQGRSMSEKLLQEEIYRLRGSGLTFTEIGERLGISRQRAMEYYNRQGAIERNKKLNLHTTLCLVDFHGVFNIAPSLFNNPNWRVIVLSGSPDGVERLAVKLAKENNVNLEGVITLPEEYKSMRKLGGYSSFRNEWKLRQIKKINPDYYFDDDEFVIRRVFWLRTLSRTDILRCSGYGDPIKTLPIQVYDDGLLYDEAREKFRKWAEEKDEEAREIVKCLTR